MRRKSLTNMRNLWIIVQQENRTADRNRATLVQRTIFIDQKGKAAVVNSQCACHWNTNN